MTRRARFWIIPAALGGIILWSYWTTISEMAERWTDDPQYSHGYLVPIFSAFLLWFRRAELRHVRLAPNWWGVAIVAAGIGLWAAGTYFYLSWFAAVSLLVCLAGLAVVFGGWPALR